MAGAGPQPASAALPRWRVFPALALGTLMSTLDISVVNIALPTLSHEFGVPLTTVEWVVLAYVTTITGLLLLFGRVADRIGRKRVYATGMVLFTVSSALCAAAPGIHALTAARAFQGLGAGMMMSNSSALLVSSFGPEERGRALGAFGATVGVGLALGPPLGGLIISLLSWHWIFLLNLPLGLVALALVRSRIPNAPPSDPGAELHAWPAALWCAALVGLTLALSRGPAIGWARPSVWPLLAVGVLLLVVFARLERRADSPLLPVALLTGPLGLAAALTLVGQAVSMSAGFFLPLYLEEVGGMDPAATGRWLALLPLTALFMAPLAGRWSDRLGPRVLTVSGLTVTAAGFVVLATLGTQAAAGRLLIGLLAVGTGLGAFTVPNTSSLLGAATPGRLGTASGLQATMRNLGITGGAAATAALVASRYVAHGGPPPRPGAFHAALPFALAGRDLFVALALVSLLAATASMAHRTSSGGDPALHG